MKETTLTDIAQQEQLDKTRIPRHIAIIPDGNRRWAQKALTGAHEGHRKGSDVAINVVRGAAQVGVKVVTLYTFSTENWSRSKEEVEFLMALLANNLVETSGEMADSGVRLHAIGNTAILPANVRDALEFAQQRTEKSTEIDLVLALNYGGRDELVRAFRRIAHEGVGENEINEALIARHLDTVHWGDPELVIRTSGEQRISNFMLWQVCYSEFYFTDTLWPDFTSKHLYEAIRTYQARTKRLGA